MRDEHYTPFSGRHVEIPIPTRVVCRFAKPGHQAEIRERTQTTFRALEWLLFVDDALIETRLYHGARLDAYPGELEDCCASLRQQGWQDAPADVVPQ